MKFAVIIIRPNRYAATKKALEKEHFFALSGKEVFGRGRKPVTYATGENEKLDEQLHQDTMTIKRMLQICIPDEEEERLIRTVLSVNRTGNEGDGKIFILPCPSCARIHTGETGSDALL